MQPKAKGFVKTIFPLWQTTALSFLVLLSPHVIQANGVTTRSALISASVPAIGLIYSYSIGDIEGIKELTLGCAVSAQLTTFLKNTVQRRRPNSENNLSFPSGHASFSFSGASYLHHRYGLGWGLPMYAVATAISIQRVNVKDHYWSDVIAGAALGFATGALFTARYPEVLIEPHFNASNRSAGLQFKYKFN